MSNPLILAIAGTLHPAAANPMTLTGDVADGTASTALDAHLTLGGGITYPVTISGLPAWITNPGSIASGTDVHLTGAYPATAGTETFTVVATDSSTPTAQTASDAQSVVVSAAASGPTLVQQAGTNVSTVANTGFDLVLSSAPTAGNTLLAIVRNSDTTDPSINVTMPTGWTMVASVRVTGSSRHFDWWKKVSDGTETTTHVSFGESSQHAGAIQEWQGAITVDTFSGAYVATAVNPASFGPTAAPPDATALPVVFMFWSATTYSSMAWSSGWTGTNTGANSYGSIGMVGVQTAAPNAAVSGSLTFTLPGTTAYWYWSAAWVRNA